MSDSMQSEQTKPSGLKLSGIGKIILMTLGLVFFLPFIFVALGIIVVTIAVGGALALAIIAGILGVVLALLAALVGALGGTVPVPVGWPWL